jgi:hypothetical protein
MAIQWILIRICKGELNNLLIMKKIYKITINNKHFKKIKFIKMIRII